VNTPREVVESSCLREDAGRSMLLRTVTGSFCEHEDEQKILSNLS